MRLRFVVALTSCLVAHQDAEELERQFSLPEAQRISPRLNNLLRNVNDLTDTRLLEISSGGTFFF